MLPLEGIRIIECAQWQQGPVAALMLADLGADVIKVEEPIGGDPSRGVERITGMLNFENGRNFYFEGNNRNKRSLTLNLKTQRGGEILYQLAEKADVFIHNFLPESVERLGVDYETLKARNPKLIYAVASGYGPKGPDANTASFDLIGLARSGLMTMVGEPGMPPLNIAGGVGDQIGGIMTAFGVLAALQARERTGVGQRVDASLLGSLMWLQGLSLAFKLIGGFPYQRTSRAEAGNQLWNYYQCADGRWIALAHLHADRDWPPFCRALGIEHLQHDPRYADITSRREHAAELTAIIDGVFAKKTCVRWLELLHNHGLIAGQVNNLDEVIADPAALANDYILDYDHPTWGPGRTIGFPITLSETPCAIRMPAPEHGQHTEEILTGVLGYDWEAVVELRNEGVL